MKYMRTGLSSRLVRSCRSREFRATDTKMTSTYIHVHFIEEKKSKIDKRSTPTLAVQWFFRLVLQTEYQLSNEFCSL